MKISVCPVCKSHSSQPYYEFGAPGRVAVHNRVCDVCGLVFQSPRPAFNDLKKYYEDYAKLTITENAEIPITFEEHVLAISRLRLQFIRPFLRDGDRVLDIGCSFGAMLKVLRDESGLNLNLTGVNPEASFARFGQQNYRLDIRIGMFEEQQFPPDSFDLIILDNVIEHFDDHLSTTIAFHELLDHGGRLFVATNNLYEPHGFLWQNFFADHTATFSPKTLKMLLESQGFTILAQDFSGHTTYEGYHYPYQYCLAQKCCRPVKYDFSANGDTAIEMLKRKDLYISSYYSTQFVAKRLYELSLASSHTVEDIAEIKSLSHLEKILAVKTAHMGGSVGSPLAEEPFRIFNHTLPPEEYFHRRIMTAVCVTDNDVVLAHSLAEKSGIAPLLCILRHYTGGLMLQSADGLPDDHRGQIFNTLRDFLGFMLQSPKRLDSFVVIHLNNADLLEDALSRTFCRYYRSNKPHACVDYRQFTDAHFEFFPLSMLVTHQNHYNSSDFLLPVFSQEMELLDDSLLIWPDRTDYLYYYRTRFIDYYAFPKSISLDLSPACNKFCDKCQFHSPRSPFVGLIQRDQLMPKELACRLIEEAANWPVKPTINMTFSGEALLYPGLFEVIAHAKSRGLAVSFFTNGVLLNEVTSKMLIDLSVDSICVSIDAFTPDIYQQLQAPDSLVDVIKNVERFLTIRGNHRAPSVGVHFVMEPRNKDQFKDYLTFWGSRVDSVGRAIIQDQFKSCGCVLPLAFPLGDRQACWAAWNNLYVRWDGKISYCGFDIDGNTSGLNVYDSSLLDIWHSTEFWRWRNAQLKNDHSVLYCKACPDWSGLRNITFRNNGWLISKTPFTETFTKVC